jgi:hypothetical protein
MSTSNIARLHSRLRETQNHDWRFDDCLDPVDVSTHWRGNVMLAAERDWQLLLPIEGAQSPRRISPERADELSGLLNRALRASFETAIVQTTLQLLSWKCSALDRTNRSLTERLNQVEHALKALAAAPQFAQLPGATAQSEQRGSHLALENIELIAKQLSELAATTFATAQVSVGYSAENDGDIGGDYVAIDLAVLGVDAAAFRESRRAFMRALPTHLDSGVLSNVIISVTRRG